MGLHATADINTRVITLTTAPVLENGDLVVDINVKIDLYSDLKEDWVASSTLRKLDFPITAIGGNAKPGGVLGTSYFINSDWKIAPYEASHRLRIAGNFYSIDGTTPFQSQVGTYQLIIEQNLSALVEVASAAITQADADNIADTVWDEALGDHQTSGTVGEKLKKDLTKSQFLGLK